jgi:hypothetical protein
MALVHPKKRRERMARHYSTKDFFRQMPNPLLARYFQGRGLFGELDFAALKETQPDALFAAWLDFEPSRLSWRLQLLRGWSHEQVSQVFAGSAGAGGSEGAGAPARAWLAVGGDQFDCPQDRLHGPDAA